MSVPLPSRAELWLVDLDPTRGHEQAGRRPCLVASTDAFNHGPAELVLVVPVTTRDKGIPFHVQVEPEQSGLMHRSFIKCEDLRSISRDRLVKRIGCTSDEVMDRVEDCLRILLEL